MTVELLNCDCMEYMATLDDDAFELAIVDPPYGIFSKKKAGSGGTWASKYGKKAKKWDHAPPPEYFNELKRVSKNQIVWGANHFGIVSDNFVVWRKLTISETFTMGMCEFASVSCNGNPKLFSFQPQDKNRFHPTQKPRALYDWLLHNYAKPGDRILDTHLGSGSSAIAAHYKGFDFVGCELDPHYFKLAQERFNKETRQIDLFGGLK